MHSFSFPKNARLLKGRDFRLVGKYGNERCGQYLKIQIRHCRTDERKLGVSVSRRFGNAVERNRFKRLVKEAFRLSQHSLPSYTHLHVRPMLSPKEKYSLSVIQKELANLVITQN